MTVNYSLGILENNPVVLSGLTTKINDLPNIDLLFSSADISDFLSQLKTHYPDVLIVDVTNNEESSELLKSIQKNDIKIVLIAFGNITNVEFLRELYSLGIYGYIRKTTTLNEMFIIIENILQSGSKYFHDDLHSLITESSSVIALSEREKAIANHIKKGLTNKEIANLEFTSTNTVAFHRRQLFKKFNVRNKEEFLCEMIAQGYSD